MTARSGKPIALGRTAEIFAWDDEHILKLHREWCPRDWVEYELKIGRIVQDAGLPVPRLGELVEVDGRRGIVYERVDGVSMARMFQAKPWLLLHFTRLLAELQAAIHACPVPADLPSQREGFARAIRNAPNLPSDLGDAALRALAVMPDGNQLCHGDFHADNVMMTARGPIVIDWMTARRGNPIADIARTLVLATTAVPPDPLLRLVFGVARSQLLAAYLKRYFEVRRRDDAQLAAWRPIVAAARMNERIPGEEVQLIAMARAGLNR